MPDESPIDRRAVIARHQVKTSSPNALSPLSVGNGEFAYTVDITGMQTFDAFHETGLPLGTQSQWGWHSFPNPDNYTLKDAEVMYDAGGRMAPYYGALSHQYGANIPPRAKAAFDWLRCNPHRIDLGRIGLLLKGTDGSSAKIEEISKINQTLDLWRGVIESKFNWNDAAFAVTTTAHPTLDAVGIRIKSTLIKDGRSGITIRFPAPNTKFRDACDWTRPEIHQTSWRNVEGGVIFHRTMDETAYSLQAWSISALTVKHTAPHEFELTSVGSDTLELVFHFLPDHPEPKPISFSQLLQASESHWENFWQTGGFVDFAASEHPQAGELERRVILSQYLAAIQCAGSTPPQETGLVCNSWFGKFHLEMHWWHAAHFPLWGRADLLEKSISWYERVLPNAKAKAKLQGYSGARWGKMLAADGRDTPSDVGEFLIWQQPHLIYLAELLYRAKPQDHNLHERLANLIFETADFMAAYPRKSADGAFQLGPPIIAAQETNAGDRHRLMNPTYELCYWQWALKRANIWKQRVGLPRNADWDNIADHLSPLPMGNGIYLGIAVEPYQSYRDHPAHLMALGWTPPTPLVDPKIMQATYDDVQKNWDWLSTWGWDYPVLAMSAAFLGRWEDAFEALLMKVQKNTYLLNGHNYQDARLPLYLPGNGGLLYAIAMIAAGWDTQGKPKSGTKVAGKWKIRYENLSPALAD